MPAAVRRRPGAKKRIRDIRKHMISNEQTDVNKFEYEFKPYPKVIKDDNRKSVKDDEGRTVKAYDRAEELALMKEYGIKRKADEPKEDVEETDGDETPAETDDGDKAAAKKKPKGKKR